MLRELWYDEIGLTTIEYALVLAIVALAAFAAFTLLSVKVRSEADRTTSALPVVH